VPRLDWLYVPRPENLKFATDVTDTTETARTAPRTLTNSSPPEQQRGNNAVLDVIPSATRDDSGKSPVIDRLLSRQEERSVAVRAESVHSVAKQFL